MLLWRPLAFVRSFQGQQLAFSTAKRRLCTAETKPREPLRILFCGADDFSIASLRALHELSKTHSDIVESIDVVHKRGKPSGRGMKVIREVPIKQAAAELALPTHPIDTFTGWQPPHINLIVAVSFGLFVPKRIINASKFGGLNLHPSLLPDLRGPSPIHYALLYRRPFTGITVQTLDPTSFDHGTILSQTGPLPIPPLQSPEGLLSELSPLGASLLTSAIRDRLYEAPQTDRGWYGKRNTYGLPTELPIDHAPKLQKTDAKINWSLHGADEILLRHRVLGYLWDDTLHPSRKRIIYKKIYQAPPDEIATIRRSMERLGPGMLVAVRDKPKEKAPRYYIATNDRELVRLESFLIEGHPAGYVDKELANIAQYVVLASSRPPIARSVTAP